MGDVFVHEHGINDSSAVGPGTRIWAFAHVLEGARVGADCNICDGVFIEGGAVVGDRVTVKCGVQLWDGVELEDDVFVGPNATFTNDPMPRSRRWLEEYPRTVVRQGASVGANATILPGLEIGIGAMVGAGAVVTRSVPPHAIVVGNPARIHGYAESGPREPEATDAPAPGAGSAELPVDGVFLHEFGEFSDLRGKLTAGEMPTDAIPFDPHRWFLVYDVPSREVRGEHAHRVCHQFLISVSGSVSVAVDDGRNRAEVTLDRPSTGIYVPPLVWASEFAYGPDTVLLVLASHEYDPDDYIRDYSKFLDEVGTADRATDQ
jgi:UDP-2-acetamido-3-amino-2,3-dideoxy-glucuronate N-acetyltransferase